MVSETKVKHAAFVRSVDKGGILFAGIILIAFIGVLLYRTKQADPNVTAASLPDGARTGDIVFFHGTRMRSMAVRYLDPGPGAMSHLGILIRSDSSLLVVHASPHSSGNTTPRVRLESLDTVLREGNVASMLLYRCTVDSAGYKAAEWACTFAERGLPFDSEFDLTTDTALYCTELVLQAYLRAGVNIATEAIDTLFHPFGRKAILFPTNIARSRLLRQVYPEPGSCSQHCRHGSEGGTGIVRTPSLPVEVGFTTE